MTQSIALPVTTLLDTDQILVRRVGDDTVYYITKKNLTDNFEEVVVGDASEIAKGIIELATNAETITGTDAVRAVTPAGLAALTASATRDGLVELAIDAEAKTGSDTARAITAANLRAVMTGLKFITFDGRSGAGVCTAVGAAVGDKVMYVSGLTAGALGGASASFETTITVINQIQQSAAGDLSLNDYLAVLLAVA